MSTRHIPVVERIFRANEGVAVEVRTLCRQHQVALVNIMASPGAGKTTFLLATAHRLADRLRIGVIEGDVASTVDSDRVRAEGFPAVQINTGGGCHLDALQVRGALDQLDLDALDLILVENVGNLVCPVGFDLGENLRIVLSSVPEGWDKPHKYPSIFQRVDAVVLNKIDLLPYLSFDEPEFRRLVAGLNPEAPVISVSSADGTGMDEWIAWLGEQLPR